MSACNLEVPNKFNLKTYNIQKTSNTENIELNFYINDRIRLFTKGYGRELFYFFLVRNIGESDLVKIGFHNILIFVLKMGKCFRNSM